MEKMIQIPEWQLKKIENTLRLCSNIHKSYNKTTCFDRCVCKAWDWVKSALENANTENGQLTIPDVSISLPNGENFKNAMDNLRNEFTKDELADLGNEC